MQQRESEVRRFKVTDDKSREHSIVESVILTSFRDVNGNLHTSTGLPRYRLAHPVLVMGLWSENERVNKIEEGVYQVVRTKQILRER